MRSHVDLLGRRRRRQCQHGRWHRNRLQHRHLEDQRDPDPRSPGDWIAPVSDEAVPRTLQVAKEGEPLSAGATSLPAMQRPGDLIVYCGARTGVIFGVAEVAGEPIRKEDEHGTWRVRVTPRLILD